MSPLYISCAKNRSWRLASTVLMPLLLCKLLVITML